MATTGIFVVCSSVFLLLIGITLSRSEECNEDILRKCPRITVGDCSDYRATQACLQNFTRPCKDDRLNRLVTEGLERLIAEGEECPGLPHGECFASVFEKCDYNISITHRIEIDVGIKTNCPSVKSKLPDAKDCFNDLKSKCQSQHARKLIDRRLTQLKRVEKICDE